MDNRQAVWFGCIGFASFIIAILTIILYIFLFSNPFFYAYYTGDGFSGLYGRMMTNKENMMFGGNYGIGRWIQAAMSKCFLQSFKFLQIALIVVVAAVIYALILAVAIWTCVLCCVLIGKLPRTQLDLLPFTNTAYYCNEVWLLTFESSAYATVWTQISEKLMPFAGIKFH